MISDVLVWVGEHGAAALAFGVAAIAVGVIIYLGHDLPPPDDEDEHARNPFRW